MAMKRTLLCFAMLSGFGVACAAGTPADPAVARGKAVYMGNCIACHNVNPDADGSLGPALRGSSRALLEAKVLRGAYPEGYTPKRETRAMVPLPQLAGSLDDLAAFLAAR